MQNSSNLSLTIEWTRPTTYTVSEMYQYVRRALQNGVEAVAQEYDIDEEKLEAWKLKINDIERTCSVSPDSTRILSDEVYLQKLRAKRDLMSEEAGGGIEK